MKDNKTNPLEKETRNLFSNWLEKLQQESWQLELVISGIVLVLIAQAKPYIDDFAVYVGMYGDSTKIPIVSVLILIKGGYIIFMTNFIMHILGRGFWIGAIGLRYVSGETDYASLKYSQRFERYLEKRVGRFDDL